MRGPWERVAHAVLGAMVVTSIASLYVMPMPLRLGLVFLAAFAVAINQ